MLSTFSIPAVAVATAASHWGGSWDGGLGFLWLLLPLFWVAVFVGIFAGFGRRWRRARWNMIGGYGHVGGWGAASKSAEVTLAERFAQGDIEEKEYRARLEVLRVNSPQPPHNA